MEKIKILISVFLILVAIWFAYPYLTSPPADLVVGNEIDSATFNAILSDTQNVFIVMDIRDINDTKLRQNILQCGVDFAGSYGLVEKNITLYSFDTNQGCVGMDRNYPISYCLKQMEQGIALYAEESNETRFYTNAMRVGISDNYEMGSCSVNVK
jgi:hypothetical protein